MRQKILGTVFIMLGAVLVVAGGVITPTATLHAPVLAFLMLDGLILLLGGVVLLSIVRSQAVGRRGIVEILFSIKAAVIALVIVVVAGFALTSVYYNVIAPAMTLSTARKHWEPAMAVVESAKPSNTWVGGNPKVYFKLYYIINGETWESDTSSAIAQIDIPKVQPTHYIPIWYNPQNPYEIIIDMDIPDSKSEMLKEQFLTQMQERQERLDKQKQNTPNPQ